MTFKSKIQFFQSFGLFTTLPPSLSSSLNCFFPPPEVSEKESVGAVEQVWQWVELQQVTHLQLVIVRLAAAVHLLGHVFVGVKQQTDTTVIPQLHMFYTCKQAFNWVSNLDYSDLDKCLLILLIYI